jgi:peroxiredoxin Q/BCP
VGPKNLWGKNYDGMHRTNGENGIIDEVIERVKTKEHAAQILRVTD